MDYLWQIHFQYTWMGLFILIAQLALFYFVLQLAKRGSAHIAAPSRWQLALIKAVHYALHVFEPLAMLILVSYFVLVHPFFHGLIIAILMLANFKHLRNYFSGRIILFDQRLHIGSRLSIGKKPDGSPDSKGIITETGRLGLHVQTNKGLQYLGYDQLLHKGFNLLDREEKGGFFKLKIGLNTDKEQDTAHDQLNHLLKVSPYINWKHLPTLRLTDRSDKNQWTANIALHHEQHLYDLMELLEERGFSCHIAKL